jgi:tetratricopeptide (TPR) repeat protein
LDIDSIATQEKEYRKAIEFCENGAYADAKPILEDLISKSPTVSEYHRVLGQIYSEEGNQERAIDYLIDALRWDPKNQYALIMVGNIYARHHEDVETAIRYYDQVVRIYPNDNLALNNIGANLHKTGKIDEALQYFLQAQAIDPKYPNTYAGLGNCYEQKREYTKAFESFIQGLKVHQKDDDLGKHLARNAFGVAEKVLQGELPDLLVGIYKQKLEEKGKRSIRIASDETISTAAKIEFAENYQRSEDLVKYNPKFIAYQHLVMHELVHLELMLEARETGENQLFTSNNQHQNNFREKLKPYAKKLTQQGIPSETVERVIGQLFEGLNNQIFNAAPDLFIEDRLYRNYPDLRPIQFVSLYNLLQQGIKAVTDESIVAIADPWVLSTSKIFNVLNAMQFKDLFALDLLTNYKATPKELSKAKALYEEFLEYQPNKLPAEEYELIENWGQDLELDAYFALVHENDFKKSTTSPEDLLKSIEEDPFDLLTDSSEKDEEMQKFLKTQEDLGLNTAVMMYMVEALEFFKSMSSEKIKEIAFEIAMQGTQGYNPELKYRLNLIPNKVFSGYQILAFYYVSWALAIPEMLAQLQMPFDEEYKLAQTLFKSK